MIRRTVRYEKQSRQPVARLTGRALWYVLLAVIAVMMLFPYAWMVSTSLKNVTEANAFPPSLVPRDVHWQNYLQALIPYGIGRSFLNSSIVSIVTVFGQLVICSTGGYAFARLPFRGREALFLVYLSTLMISYQVTLIPLYLMMRTFGLLDSYAGLIVPGLFSPLGTFLLRQYIRQIPNELDEAALIDGGNHWTIFVRVILPLCRPALAALAVLSFLATWNDLLWPLVGVSSKQLYTLPLAIASFAGQYVTLLNLQMAGAVMTMMPVVIVFLILQRQFVAGIGFSSGMNR